MTGRVRIIHRAGRLTRPQRELTLTMAGDEVTEREFEKALAAIEKAA